jgi:tetratricopeptide (TPR) repeat protein
MNVRHLAPLLLVLSVAGWVPQSICAQPAFASQPPLSAADTLVEQNHYKRARVIVEARLREDPRDAHAYYLASRIQEAMGHLHEAVALAEKSVEFGPAEARNHAQLAECYAYTADRSTWVKGIGFVHLMKKELAATFAIHSHDTDALLVAMMFAFHAPSLAGGDRKKAYELADEMIQYDPRWGYLAKARLAEEDSPDATIEGWLKKAVQYDPRHYRALQEAATFYCCAAKQKNLAEAERLGKQMLQLDPGQAMGYKALASVYARWQRWADLDAILSQAEKAVPDNLTPYYQAAEGLIEIGQDLPRAERYLARYMTQESEGREPERGQAKWLLATLYEKTGRTPDAIRELEAAIRISPDFEPAKKDLRRLRRG